jgi:hypothetical protein
MARPERLAAAVLLLAAGAVAEERPPALHDLAALRRLWTSDPAIRDFVGPCGECGDPFSATLQSPAPEAVAAMVAALTRNLAPVLGEPLPTVAVRLSPPPPTTSCQKDEPADVVLARD